MTAYLDYNIYTSIADGEYSLDKLQSLNLNIDKIYYSAAHIQEVYNIKHADSQTRNVLIQRKLSKISEIAQNSYIYHELKTNKIHFLVEHPDSVFRTISEFPFAQQAMNSFVNLVGAGEKDNFRIMLGIDPKRMNNYKPAEVVSQLNSHLVSAGHMSFLEMIEMGMSYFPDDGTYGLHNRIAGVFELLDYLGYWKDRETLTSNYARLWDANHAHYASFCDYYISDDKRNRNKARVVYEIYGIKTKVHSGRGEGV